MVMESMEIKDNLPIVVFDNECYLCVKFAKFVNFFGRGKFLMVGHHTELGEKIRNEILDESALEMFWFIDGKNAYGGRAALIPLIKSIFSNQSKMKRTIEINEQCNQDCKTIKAVFLRSSSLFTNSKKISIK